MERYVKHIGDKYLNTLEMTIINFYVGDRTSIHIKPLRLNVETFRNYSGECTDKRFYLERNERDPIVADYLKKNEAILLREAYIGYLLNEDFSLLRNMDSNEG